MPDSHGHDRHAIEVQDAGGGESAATGITSETPLQLARLAKTFGSRRVLHPFELTIGRGEVRALLGQNGSGKSTLIKILSGLYLPDELGVCLVDGRQLVFGDPRASRIAGLRFVHQDLGLITSASVADNLAYTGGFTTKFGTLRRRSQRADAIRSLESVGLALDPDVLVETLSPAQRTGVAVARAIALDGDAARVLVLDEPTATLPESEVKHLHVMVRQAADRGIGILYVTHHLDEVFQLADSVSVLRDGYLVESGPVESVSREALIHALVGSELEAVRRPDGNVRELGDVSFTVTSVRSDVLEGVSFEARAGEVVGFYGLTGSGRESILATLYGATNCSGGSVCVAGKEVSPLKPATAKAAGIAYVPPDRKVSGVFPHLSATENLSLADLKPFWNGFRLRLAAERADCATWFDSLQVSPRDGLKAQMATFSGGNQQKIIFGKWLRTAPLVLLLAEPTQGVDVGAKAELHRLILEECKRGLAVVVSSSDTEELATLCDRIIFLDRGQIIGEIAGGDFTEVQINSSFHRMIERQESTTGSIR